MNPKYALEKAVHTWFTALTLTNLSTSNVYKGTENNKAIDDQDDSVPQVKELPCLIVEADGEHEEAVYNTRVYRGFLNATVEADAQNTTDATFNTICAEVFGKFNIQELATNISTANSSFTVLFARIVSNSGAINNGQNRQNTIRIEFVYSQADI